MIEFKPQNHTAAELLTKLGFRSANRGYVLLRRRGRSKSDSPVQIRALTNVDGSISLHEDFLDNGKHISKKGERTQRFYEILKDVDAGLDPRLSRKLKRNWRWADHIDVHDPKLERMRTTLAAIAARP